MKRSLAGLIAGVVCIAAELVAPATAADLTPVRAAYIPVVSWLPAWVAKDKGIFEKNGLDVTLSATQNLSVLPGTLGRQFDFAPSTPPDIIKAVLAGIDVVAIAGEGIETKDNPSTHLIVRKDSPITGMQDLKGKVIATPTLGAIIHVSVLHDLKKNGIDLDSIRAVEVPFPNMPDQLKAGNVDVVEALEPFAGQLLAAGNRSLGDPLLSVGDQVLYTFWISERKWATDNHAVVEAWVASLEQAKQYMDANPQEARAILAKYTKLPEPVVQKIPFVTYRFSLNAQDFAVWVNVLQELGQIAQPLDENSLVLK
ncbi:MAG: ABC transporter substrate-binding protein [Bradyrhizobium sp.]|uniref:ABC transporter substrate-binding protein n=1 Tax=Bradyrhizobium sp. TaxID=376 RepID=UPI001D9EFE25|nr:ABC transporter substrate-binding protein [Bradyrhizobium sp.]MBV9566494.1 ABC transporter substrate-binding protein [Bradyrhizobium sp.]